MPVIRCTGSFFRDVHRRSQHLHSAGPPPADAEGADGRRERRPFRGGSSVMARALLRPVLAVVMLSLVVGTTLGVGPAPARAASQPRPEATSFPLTPELSLNADSDLYPNYVP